MCIQCSVEGEEESVCGDLGLWEVLLLCHSESKNIYVQIKKVPQSATELASPSRKTSDL